MSARVRAISLLSAARVATREARGNTSRYALDASKLANAAPQTNDYMVRTSLSQNLISVSENLNGVKDTSIRSAYPNVFKKLPQLIGQRNILAHEYGHADEGIAIDWASVWTTINNTFRNSKLQLTRLLTN